jgi:hypothetical protein
MNIRRMLYYGLTYPLLLYGIVVWRQSAKVLTRQIFTLQKRAIRYTAGLKQLKSCRDSSRHLKILTVYSLCIQETILYAKEKCNCTANKQVHIKNTRNNAYHKNKIENTYIICACMHTQKKYVYESKSKYSVGCQIWWHGKTSTSHYKKCLLLLE